MEQEVTQGQEPAWYQLLAESKASQIVPKRPLIYVSYTEDVGTLLKKLSEANVISAVITDPEKPGVFGFVDVFDLLVYVLEVTNQSTDLTKESIENLKWEGKCFARAEAGPLTNFSQTDPYVTVSEDTSLLEVVKIFASEVHRLAVVDKVQKERVLNIVSQSDVVRFLTKRGVWIGSKLEKPISEVGLGPLGVSAVRDDTPTVEVLRYMKRLSVRGVAVVDKNNRLIANFSATDLLGLTEENFPLLALNVKDFLCRMYGFPKPPVFCKIDDSVETIMLKFAVHKVHRIYVVNETMQPGGIITLTDIMQFLLAA
jgi:CBS domain-containing protein